MKKRSQAQNGLDVHPKQGCTLPHSYLMPADYLIQPINPRPPKEKARVDLAFAERETGLEPATSTLARWPLGT
jgi:hypothetical protein